MGDEARPGVTVQHELKTWPEYFQAIVEGRKTFELRKNDRGFLQGDVIRLQEWCPTPYATCTAGHPGHPGDHPTCGCTGRSVLVRVTYVLAAGSDPRLGLTSGYAVLGVAPLEGHPAEQAINRLLRAILPDSGEPCVDAAIMRVKEANIIVSRHAALGDEASQLAERLGDMQRRIHAIITELSASGHDANCPAGWFADAGRAGACTCGVSAMIVKLGAIIGLSEAPTRSAYASLLEAARAGLCWLEENRPDCDAINALREAIEAVERYDGARLGPPPGEATAADKPADDDGPPVA